MTRKWLLLLSVLFASQSFAHNKDLRNGNIESVYPNRKKIVLTFDDGPNNVSTPKILATLRKYNIKATFFVLGKNAKKYPQVMKEIQRDGHIIANHSYAHENISKYSFWNIKKKMKTAFFSAHSAIVPYTEGVNHWYFRAPYGAWQKRAAKVVNKTKIGKNYIGPVLWDIGGQIVKDSNGVYQQAADWGCWNKKMTVDECLEGYMNRTKRQNGGVVLLHDIHTKSALMLEKMIPLLNQQGYEFINLDEVGLKK